MNSKVVGKKSKRENPRKEFPRYSSREKFVIFPRAILEEL